MYDSHLLVIFKRVHLHFYPHECNTIVESSQGMVTLYRQSSILALEIEYLGRDTGSNGPIMCIQDNLMGRFTFSI